MSAQGVSGNVFDFKMLKRVLQLAKPYRWVFILSCVISIGIALLAPARPAIIQKTVDDYILHNDANQLLNLTLLMIGMLLGEGVLRYYFTMLTRTIGQNVVQQLRMRVFKHILRSRIQYFDKTPVGTNLTRTISDVESINDVFANGFSQTMADLLMIVFIIAFMLLTNVKMALISLASIPFMFLAIYLFKEGVKKSFIEVRHQIARINTFLNEHITGMKVIQIMNAEKEEQQKFENINSALRNAHIRGIWYYSVFFPAVEFLKACGLGLMVWIGASLILNHEIASVGIVIAFANYIDMLFRPLRFLADRFNTLQMGLVSSERVFSLLDKEERINESGTLKPHELRGKIEFANVHFSYNEQDFALQNVSFNVSPGETLAIVGATGSGKTSIINLLLRFYEFQKGQITIDGNDIRDLEAEWLRQHISVVLQDVFLFKGSIRENISMNDSRISENEILQAAKDTGADAFIRQLPGNYDYNVMERGATLSTGQRQLISFTRALVFKPSLLILDEATANIDTESELIIQRAIEKLIQNRTSIVIAHRLSTIRHANKILVMDKGAVAECGTHDELLNKGGHYARLYAMQYKKQQLGESVQVV